MVAGVAQASWRVILRAVSLAAAGMLVASSLAFGQAAVEQYIPSTSPAGHHHRDRGSESGSTTGQSSSSSGSQAGAAVGAGAASVGGGGGGSNGGANSTPSGSAKVPALQADSGSGGGGNAPGTDYPLTTFVYIVAGIILLVLAIRFIPPLIRRARLRGAS